MTPELFTQYISPIYISTSNMMTPIADISFNQVQDFAGLCYDFGTFVWKTIIVLGHTLAFIIKEAVVAVDANLSFTEKMLLSLCLYNLIASFVNEIDKMHQNNITQDRLEKIEKYVKFLKKSVTIRDNCETMWSEEINTVRNENCNKMQELEKELSMYKEKVDEQTNIINEHQTNEQKIFQKISQVNKELRKLKKEMEQYQ
jgi:hypothetical protein